MNTLTISLTRWLCATLVAGTALLSATTAQAQNYWIGTTDTIYTKPNNWSMRRVPNSTDNVVIQPVGTSVSVPTETPSTTPVVNQPALSAALGIGQAGNVTIASGARLRLGPQSELDLFGNLTNNGAFVGAGALVTKGTLSHAISSTNALNSIPTITINDLIIDTNAPVMLYVPLRLNRLLSLVGDLTTNAVDPLRGIATGLLTMLSTPTVTSFTVPAAVDNQGGVVIGPVTVQRAIDNSLNPGLGYRHYSSPVNNTTVRDLTTATFTPNITAGFTYNTSPTPPTTTPFPTVYAYNQRRVNRTNTSPNFDKGFFVPSTLDTFLVRGRGYAVNLDGSQLVDFVGPLNNGDIPVSMERNATGTLNSGDAGWQFLGNPYPAPLDYSRVVAADRPGLEASIYVFRSTGQYTGMYRAYTNGMGGNPVIPIGQGFFARLATAGSTATFMFRNSQRLITSDGTTFQRPTADVRPQVELTLNESGNTAAQDYLNVYFQSGSTAGLDAEYDAVKLPNSNGLNLSSLTASGQALSIDGRPAPVGQLTVPLQVFAPVSGSYTLNAAKLLNMNGLRPYLRDIQQGALIDLTQQPSYTFALNATNFNARFELVFSAQPLAAVAPAAVAQQVALYPSPAENAAFVELPATLGSQAVAATLTDALGRAVRTATLPAQGAAAHQINLAGLSSGIYLLRLDTSAGVITKRLAVK
ncbi:MAG: T9SS type A sorting domain-containing protein [Hymenobacter sp.]|nr:MAG: T9SS type A sorting domain-containing protein [Hymenobacter sp.]